MKIAGSLKLELAQYIDLAAYAQIVSELDKDTRERLAQWERIKEILKQPQYKPVRVEHQVIILYTVLNRYLSDIPVDQISQFEREFLNFVDNNFPEIVDSIKETKDLTEETEQKIIEAVTEFKKSI